MFGGLLGNKKAIEKEAEAFSGLEEGLDEDKIVIELQPQIDHKCGKLVGAEALSRYRETDENLLAPMMFVPLLESASVVSELDLNVVGKVAETVARWKVSGMGSIPVSINLSRIDFAETGFMDRVHALFLQNGIAPDQITFELHESALIDNFEKMAKRLMGAKDKGYRLAIDDYGSSGHLVLLPYDLGVDTIKLDVKFLRALAGSQKSRSMGQGLVNGLTDAGVQLVAGGIETDADLKAAEAFGIHVIQGFYYDRPLSVDIFEEKYMK